MKQLFTLCLALMSVTAMAQWPSLPYNPDENGDGLIGVVDLAALLAQYNTEFASAVVSEDGESAIVYMGEMGYPQCKYSCDHLPGFWRMPEIDDLVPVWNEVYNPMVYQETWLKTLDGDNSLRFFLSNNQGPNDNDHGLAADHRLTKNRLCYCAAKQMPRVEYDQCITIGTYGSFMGVLSVLEIQHKECVNSKLDEGWMLNGATRQMDSGSDIVLSQSLWRWAE